MAGRRRHPGARSERLRAAGAGGRGNAAGPPAGALLHGPAAANPLHPPPGWPPLERAPAAGLLRDRRPEPALAVLRVPRLSRAGTPGHTARLPRRLRNGAARRLAGQPAGRVGARPEPDGAVAADARQRPRGPRAGSPGQRHAGGLGDGAGVAPRELAGTPLRAERGAGDGAAVRRLLSAGVAGHVPSGDRGRLRVAAPPVVRRPSLDLSAGRMASRGARRGGIPYCRAIR